MYRCEEWKRKDKHVVWYLCYLGLPISPPEPGLAGSLHNNSCHGNMHEEHKCGGGGDGCGGGCHEDRT